MQLCFCWATPGCVKEINCGAGDKTWVSAYKTLPSILSLPQNRGIFAHLFLICHHKGGYRNFNTQTLKVPSCDWHFRNKVKIQFP